ncbi:proteasome accessory factor C [Candidatus Nanopelagicus abundans]|uniref:Proteasome accessory factor C n=1 Tax=Candidatus Nanopelagicus abundans TaxID=1884916 RepID=A0A249L4L8_9ACTN|nr:WYL domain-containing protein [Candidatus Nanopelagicus abundans]ASY23879.1 proteasome accessory factor C [Candidatus Nanopelagicus abundans]
MVDNAANRALRTMDLIPYILENPGVSIIKLAKQFSVTEKQIESDLQLVFMCGLPGYTPYELIDLIFEDGVVSIIDPQVLDKPRRFTKSELVVIALGLQLLGELSASDSARLSKIKLLSNKITQLGGSNSIIFAPSSSKSPFVEVISKAITNKKSLTMQYQSLVKDEVSIRTVFPHNLYFMNGNLYLSAMDLAAKADRVFKVELIKTCEVGDDISSEVVNDSNSTLEVVLDVQKTYKNFIERNSSIITAVEEQKNCFRVHLKLSNLEWLKRSILSNSPGIKVISPSLLAKEVATLATSLLASYQAVKPI